MKRNGSEIEDGRGRELFADLGRQTPPLDDRELRAMARSAAAEPRSPQAASTSLLSRTHWAHPFRWVGATVAVALVVGSGLGFSLGSSLTSPESARASFVGTGFLPAQGWTVVQSGRVDSRGVASAVAANVPLRPEDDLEAVPYATLEALPARGVVIVATFTTRGDPGADFAYPPQALPLQIATATPVPNGLVVPRPLGEYRLRAGIRGTNVDARIYFGTPKPSGELRAAAQRQLNQLAVAAERVTIFARPTIIGEEPVIVYGSVDSGRAGEEVTIQAKDCGSDFFRVFAGTTTRDGGGWSTVIFPRINTTLRAVWKDSASGQVGVRFRTPIFIDRQRQGAGFRVGVFGVRRSFWHKRVLVQRRQGGTWKTVKTVVLTEPAWTKFSLSVPKGSFVRAVLPLSQARPCYLPGFSRTLRT
ncbi:MAG: hypothetical protein H0U82_02005 [Actinobacteria bacterium]|nr:hypothetical protein [Actinomycetota bacterium]